MERTSGMRHVAVALAWMTHPVTVGAVVVLLVNDHLLKAAYPGAVTGKLSDVAGLVFAPALVAAVLCLLVPRVPAGLAAVAGLAGVGLAFTWVKATTAGAGFASAAWSLVRPSTVLADGTDLVALPALAVAWWTWTRVREAELPERWTRTVRAALVLPVAVLAVAATSAPYYPAVARVQVVDGRALVGLYNGFHALNADPTAESWPSTWLSTSDGRTWVEDPPSTATLPPTSPPLNTQACVPDRPGHCYRVVPGRMAVEETVDDGRTWRMSWEVSDGRREFLARQVDDLGSTRVDLASAEVAVLPVTGGHLVFVANRRDGLAVRFADGTWQRVGVPSDRVPPEADPLVGAGQHVWLEFTLAGSAVPVLVSLALLPVLTRRRRLAAGAASLTVLGSLALLVGVAAGTWFAGIFGIVVAMAGLVWCLATVAGDRGLRWWHPVGVLGVAVLTAVGIGWSFYGWSAGNPDGYDTAARIAVLVAIGGAVVSAAVTTAARLRGPRPPEPGIEAQAWRG
ncbi:hypothetical protein ACFO1B_16210 [Dactylosporangium siamense]|uniref:Uncharacterized protein n=1 Tax=Dactylosporangium siamense TaxID=685454 RepID=A0A919UB71_9ACTN|nr:hypothetical protein [Dactylosporangium siamense]GIG45385.1 hypothetical protein Dsi01nite_034260 [Dactylosporangium siamense]